MVIILCLNHMVGVMHYSSQIANVRKITNASIRRGRHEGLKESQRDRKKKRLKCHCINKNKKKMSTSHIHMIAERVKGRSDEQMDRQSDGWKVCSRNLASKQSTIHLKDKETSALIERQHGRETNERLKSFTKVFHLIETY